MTLHNLEIPAIPDSSGVVFDQPLEVAMTLGVATLDTTDGITIPAPAGSDIGVRGSFLVPEGYVGSPSIVVDCIVAEAANVLAFGTQIRAVAVGETVDAAYEAEDTATISSWTGIVAEDRVQLAVPLTPTAPLRPGDRIYYSAYRDDSADTQTGAVHDVRVLFRYEGDAAVMTDHGFKFEWLTTATIRMALDGDRAVNDSAKVWVTDGTNWNLIAVPSADLPLGLDLTTTGKGGILAAHAPEAVQFYDVYVTCEAAGVNAGLLAVDPGTDMSLVTLPGSDTHWSRVVWGVSNAQGGAANITRFYWAGPGECIYDEEHAMLTDGTATARTLIDMTNFVPSTFVEALVLWRTSNNSATHVQVDWFSQSTGNKRMTYPENVRNIAGAYFTIRGRLEVPNAGGAADSLYYLHSASPALGTTVRALRWRI